MDKTDSRNKQEYGDTEDWEENINNGSDMEYTSHFGNNGYDRDRHDINYEGFKN